VKAILDHVAIAVGDLRSALAFYRDALGLEVEPPEEVAAQRVRARFIPVGESKLELLEATTPDSVIAKYVAKRGPGLHHVTLRVENIRAALDELKRRGVRLVDEEPRRGAGGALVAFVHPSSAQGVLIELKEPAAPGFRRRDTRPPDDANSSAALHVTRYALGDLELISLYDGFLRLDGGSMFGVVPRTMWQPKAPPDDRHRIRLAMRPLVIRGARTLLIDAGLGDKEHGKFLEIYGVDRERSLDDALAEAGLAPADIDIVVATHLHFDHAGGFTVRDAAGRLRPRFPRARYVVRRGEWEDAMHPHERNKASYLRDNYAPLAEAGVLELVAEDQTIMPGVRVRRTGGHTMHHQIVLIESGGRQAAFVADLMPTTAHVPDAWIMGFDLYPMDTLSAKKRFAAEAIERRTLVFFEHDPALQAGYLVEQDGKRDVEGYA
jgi:methylmalonyl-CoA epimerase